MERNLTEKDVVAVGFEPTKLSQRLLRPPPLTARAHNQNGNSNSRDTGGGDRTHDLSLKRRTLLPLSYTGYGAPCVNRTHDLLFTKQML